MTPNIRWYLADGTTPAPGQIDWGFVGPGQSGEAKTYVFKNEGDTPATNPALSILPVGNSDVEAWITGEHEAGTFTASQPLDLPDLPPGASGTLTVTLAVPPGAPLSSRPLLAQVGLAYDLDA